MAFLLYAYGTMHGQTHQTSPSVNFTDNKLAFIWLSFTEILLEESLGLTYGTKFVAVTSMFIIFVTEIKIYYNHNLMFLLTKISRDFRILTFC